MPSLAFGPIGDSAVLALTSSSQTFALGTLSGDGPALRLQSLNSGQTAWYIKFGTSGAVTVSVTDGQRIAPGGQDEPTVIPVPLGSTHYAILAEGISGNVLASYGGYDDTRFGPAGASQIVAVTGTDQAVAVGTLGTISPAISLVSQNPSIMALWVKLGTGAVTGSVTTSMKVFPGTVEEPMIIPVLAGETHLSIFCEGVGGNVTLTPGQIDHTLPFPLSRSGDRWGVMPYVNSNGELDIGRIIDFHNTDGDTSDSTGRVRSDDIGTAGQDLSWFPSAGADANVLKRFVTIRNSGLTTGDFPVYDGANFVRALSAGQLLVSGTVSAAATLDLVLTSYTAFRALKFVLESFIPATDDVELWMRVSTNAGSSYDATGYSYASMNTRDAGAAVFVGNAAAANQILIAGSATIGESVSSTAAESGVQCEVTLYDQTISQWQRIGFEAAWFGATVDNTFVKKGAASREASQDTDAVRFLFESGNITSGKYSIYGIA